MSENVTRAAVYIVVGRKWVKSQFFKRRTPSLNQNCDVEPLNMCVCVSPAFYINPRSTELSPPISPPANLVLFLNLRKKCKHVTQCCGPGPSQPSSLHSGSQGPGRAKTTNKYVCIHTYIYKYVTECQQSWQQGQSCSHRW